MLRFTAQKTQQHLRCAVKAQAVSAQPIRFLSSHSLDETISIGHPIRLRADVLWIPVLMRQRLLTVPWEGVCSRYHPQKGFPVGGK